MFCVVVCGGTFPRAPVFYATNGSSDGSDPGQKIDGGRGDEIDVLPAPGEAAGTDPVLVDPEIVLELGHQRFEEGDVIGAIGSRQVVPGQARRFRR